MVAERMYEGVVKHFAFLKKEQKRFDGNRVLREILQELDREEARFSFLGAMQLRYALPGEYVERTIEYYKKHNPTDAAFYAYLDRQNEYEYLELFAMKSEHHAREEMIMQKRIEKRLNEVRREYAPLTQEEQKKNRTDYNFEELSIEEAIERIDIYERRGDGWGASEAAKIALKIDLPEEAIRIHERRKDFKDAAEIAESEGLLERALEDYELDRFEHARAGQVARRIANEKRDARIKRKRFSFLSKTEYNKEEKKYLKRAVQNFARDSNWHDSAFELAESIYSIEERVRLHDECEGPYNALEYAITQKAVTMALEICDNHGFYEYGLLIATQAAQKKKAATYGKIIALKQYGDNKYTLEEEIEKANKRTDQETVQYVASLLGEEIPEDKRFRKKDGTAKYEPIAKGVESTAEAIVNYSRKYVHDLIDRIIVEGAHEAIKEALGVKTTGQLIKKAVAVVLTATSLSSPYAAYHLYNTSQQSETSQVVSEAQKPEVQEVNPTTQTVQYKTKEVKTIQRGCGQ